MNRGRGNRRILIMVAAGGVVVIAGLVGLLQPVRWVYDHTVVPVSRSLAAAGSGLSQTTGDFGDVRNLASENTNLKQENATLRQRLASDADAKRDNDILRRQLGLDVAGAPAETAAEVVAFQPDSYRQFITINKGTSAGIKVGQAALSDGALIGLVSETTAKTARITLVTDPEFKLTAKDQDSATGATGVLQGQLGSGLIMEKIDQTVTIKPGDTITSAGLGGSVPAGLFIGQVQSVNNRANTIFQSAQVSISLVPSHLRFVFVVTGS